MAMRLNFLFRRPHGRAGLKVSFRESDSKFPATETSGRTTDSGYLVALPVVVVVVVEEDRGFVAVAALSESLSMFEGTPPSIRRATAFASSGPWSSGLLELSSVGWGAQAAIKEGFCSVFQNGKWFLS